MLVGVARLRGRGYAVGVQSRLVGVMQGNSLVALDGGPMLVAREWLEVVAVAAAVAAAAVVDEKVVVAGHAGKKARFSAVFAVEDQRIVLPLTLQREQFSAWSGGRREKQSQRRERLAIHRRE